MAPNCECEVLRHDSPPTFNPPNIRKLVESVVDFDEVEDFRICLQRRLVRNLKVSPAARSDKVLNHELTHSIGYYAELTD